MSKELNSDKQLREKFNDFSEQPPPLVWDNIKGNLALQRKRKRMAYLGWVSAAAIVVLAFIGGWYFSNNNEIEAQKLAKENIQNESNTENINIEKEEKNTIAEVYSDEENAIEMIELSGSNDLNKEGISLVEEKVLPVDMEHAGKERIRMERLDGRNIRLQQNTNSKLLAEYASPKKSYTVSEADEFLMASNVRTLAGNKKAQKGWKMGMHISPGYSSNVSNHSQNYAQDMSSSSDGGNGNVGGGFSIQYKTSKKLRIESGVYYAQNGQKSGSSNSNRLFSSNKDMASVAPGFDNEYREDLGVIPARGMSYSNTVQVNNGNLALNSRAGVIEMRGTPKGAVIANDFESLPLTNSNTMLTSGEFSQVFDFIEIPLYLRYSIIDSKFGIEILGGINAGVVVGNNAYINNNYGLQNVGKTQDISTINIAGTIGVGLNYDLGKHISVAVEPRMNYYLNSINQNSDVDFRPYRIGFYTGLYYDF